MNDEFEYTWHTAGTQTTLYLTHRPSGIRVVKKCEGSPYRCRRKAEIEIAWLLKEKGVK